MIVIAIEGEANYPMGEGQDEFGFFMNGLGMDSAIASRRVEYEKGINSRNSIDHETKRENLPEGLQ
jgi:hypothetical protein